MLKSIFFVSALQGVLGLLDTKAEDVLRDRSQRFFYFSTYDVENKMGAVNRTDPNSLGQTISFDKNPEDIGFLDSEQMCVSNTFVCAVFSALTFSSACSIVVATQLLS